MKNIMMAVMVSVVGAQLYAGDGYRFSYEKTAQGYRYLVKNQNDKVLVSAVNPQDVFVLCGSDCEQFKRVLLQVDSHNKDLTSSLEASAPMHKKTSQLLTAAQKLSLEAVKQSNYAVKMVMKNKKQLICYKMVMYTSLLINAGLVGYYWYQQWYGTQQNCSLQ
jgi:hypothetical protein